MPPPTERSHKVGIVPYARVGEAWHYLILLPRPKRSDMHPPRRFGLVRGTARDLAGNDLRDAEVFAALPPEQIEAPRLTALNEAWEEAGIGEDDVMPHTLRDHGLIAYASEKHPHYPIHFFSAQTDATLISRFIARAADASGLDFQSLAAIEELTRQGHFKPGYLTILQRIAADLKH